jgi:hypothetical protein
VEAEVALEKVPGGISRYLEALRGVARVVIGLLGKQRPGLKARGGSIPPLPVVKNIPLVV